MTAAGQGPKPDTYAVRQDKYKSRMDTILRLLTGLGGLALVSTGDLGATVLGDTWPAALLITMVLITGGSLGMAWASFGWAHTILKRAIDNGTVVDSSQWERTRFYVPDRGEVLYKIGTVLLAVSGLLIIVMFWLEAGH